MQVRKLVSGCCLLALVSIHPAYAQTDQDALNQMRRAIQLEEQRRVEERRQLDDSQRTLTVLPGVEPAPELTIPDGAPCFTVNAIHINGATLISPKTVAATYASLSGTCIGIAEINNLVVRLTHLYVEAGYVTSRAYIPQQNLASGELQLHVIEGYVESVRIEGGPRRLLLTAFPGLVGRPLNLREIEQGLDQLNRLRSAAATIQFVPGTEAGATEVVIRYQRANPLNLSLGYNNSGQESTGLYKANLGLGWDSPLGLSDFLHISHSTNARDRSAQRQSESSSVHYTVPFGHWTWSVNASQFEYANLITGNVTSFQTRGTSQTLQASLDRLLSRNQNSKTNISLAIKEQRSENYIDEVLLLTSSRENSVVSLGISRDIYLQGNSTIVLSAGYERGLSVNYLSEAVALQPDTPNPKFEKYLVDITMAGAAQWLHHMWQWRSSVHGQYSDDMLFSTESLAIGSQYTVHGFKDDGLSGDTGAYWRNELSQPSFPFRRQPRVRVEPFVGVDAGFIENADTLAGWAAGLRLSAPNISAQVTYAQPIKYPDTLNIKKQSVDFSLGFSKAW